MKTIAEQNKLSPNNSHCGSNSKIKSMNYLEFIVNYQQNIKCFTKTIKKNLFNAIKSKIKINNLPTKTMNLKSKSLNCNIRNNGCSTSKNTKINF
jgi:hypothetical protein